MKTCIKGLNCGLDCWDINIMVRRDIGDCCSIYTDDMYPIIDIFICFDGVLYMNTFIDLENPYSHLCGHITTQDQYEDVVKNVELWLRLLGY